MKLYRYHLPLVLAFLLIPAIVVSQVTLTGTVRDAKTGEALAGANLIPEGSNLNVSSDDQGRFTISSGRDFDFITVTRVGYKKLRLGVSDKSKAIEIKMEPIELHEKEVLITGNALSKDQLGNASSVGTLSPTDLNGTDGLSLEQSMNTIPGVDMQSRTPWGGQRIFIRGYYPAVGNNANFNGYGYQEFINNVPVTDASGSTIMDDIDFSTLGSVEVIKGPASSLYGSPIGGSVNMWTRKPEPNETGIDQQVLGGSNGLMRTNTVFHTADDNSDIFVNYGHQTYDGFRPHDASKKDYLVFAGDFEPSTNQTLSTYFSYSRSYEELAGELDSAVFYNREAVSDSNYLANGSHVQIESFRAGVTDNYKISEHFSNMTTVFGSGHTLGQPFAHGFTDYNQFNFGARSVFGYEDRWGEVGIHGTLGAMTQRSNVTSDGIFIVPAPIPNPPSFPSTMEDYAINSFAFTEWMFALPSEFTVTLGGSLIWNEFGIRNMLNSSSKVYNGSTITYGTLPASFAPRASLLKMLTDDISGYVSVSSGYTPPLLSNIIANNGTVDAGLKPEHAVQYEIGSKGNLMDKVWTYQVAVYDMEINNQLVSQTVNTVTFTTNAGKQRNQGEELLLSYFYSGDKDAIISHINPWVSFTHIDAKYVDFKSNNNNDSTTVDYSNNKAAGVVPNQLAINLDVAANGGLYLHGTYTYMDKAPVTFDNANFMKSFSLLSAKIGWEKSIDQHWILNLLAGGDNLLANTYYTFLFVGPTIGGLAQPQDGGNGDGYILPGPYKATFYGDITLSYKF